MSNDSNYIASCDTLKKINVVTWPNVFNMQSVMLEHTLAIHYMCMNGSGDTIASLSEPNAITKKQDLYLTKTTSAEVVQQSQVTGISSMAWQTKRSSYLLLNEENTM